MSRRPRVGPGPTSATSPATPPRYTTPICWSARFSRDSQRSLDAKTWRPQPGRDGVDGRASAAGRLVAIRRATAPHGSTASTPATCRLPARTCIEAGTAEHAAAAWRRGSILRRSLIEPEAAAIPPGCRGIRSTPNASPGDPDSFPSAQRAPEVASRRFATLGLAVTTLARPEGFFAFQRERFWLNTTPHPRWVQAPMLAALTHFIASCESSTEGDCDTSGPTIIGATVRSL